MSIYRTNVASVGSVFNDMRKVKVLSLPETIKEKSTFRAKALRRELVTTNSWRRAFARNVDFSFIVSGSERTFTFRVSCVNISLFWLIDISTFDVFKIFISCLIFDYMLSFWNVKGQRHQSSPHHGYSKLSMKSQEDKIGFWQKQLVKMFNVKNHSDSYVHTSYVNCKVSRKFHWSLINSLTASYKQFTLLWRH